MTREYDAANVAGTQRFQRFAYDHAGRTIFASYPASVHNPTTGTWSEYDALGRPTSVAQDSELGLLTTVTQYLAGFETRVTSPKSHQTTTRYLAWDQPTTDFPVRVAHPEGAYTHITRDVFGKPTVIRRSNSNSPTGGTLAVNRTYAYNTHQELCRSVEPETGATLMGFDAAGNLEWSAAGLPSSQACEAHGTSPAVALRRVDRTYDARNRIKTLEFPDGNGDQTWDYYADGKPQQISTWNIGFPGADPKETRNLYTWNRRRLLKTELIAVPAWYTFSVTHDYNANGHQDKLWYPSGHLVTTTVNALGQPTAISGSGGAYASGITHHPNGAVAGFTYGNGIVHAMVQNARQLPDTVSSVYAGEEFLHDGYAYDEHANVLAIADLRLGEGGARSRAMTYDGMDRLTTVASPMYGTTGANYVYNVLDDLVHVNIGGKPEHTRNHHYCYNAEHQLAEIRTGGCGGMRQFELKFDDQGNLKSRKPEGGTAQGYRFDFGNRLREVDGIERYRYDGHGRRVLAMNFVSGIVFSQYGLDGKLLYQKSDRTGLQTDHVYLSNTLVAIHERPASGTGPEPVKYQHTDGLGSPVVVTRQDRSRAEESEYEPYGLVINRPPRDGPGYTGHVEDAATGLVYMQQRYYDPQIGRFLSVDPVTAYSNPVAMFNRYRYANNSPYRFKDPDGRKCETTDGKASCTFDEFKNNKGETISREQALSSGNRLTRALGIDRGSRILKAEAAMTAKYVDAKRLAATGGEVTIKGNQALGIPDQNVSGAAIVTSMESTRTIANDRPNPTRAASIASVKVTVTGAPAGEPINFWRVGEITHTGRTFGHEILHTIYSGVGLANRGWTNADFNLQHQTPFDEASDAIR